MAHRKNKISAQLVEDEEYQLRHEKVAGIDIAKAKGDVCTRLPAAREGGRRRSRVEENVPARARDILELGSRLIADGVELVIAQVVPSRTRPRREGQKRQRREAVAGSAP